MLDRQTQNDLLQALIIINFSGYKKQNEILERKKDQHSDLIQFNHFRMLRSTNKCPLNSSDCNFRHKELVYFHCYLAFNLIQNQNILKIILSSELNGK
ncbi:hypothetical protein pb186bvf_016454 [Paramecium bursaria]